MKIFNTILVIAIVGFGIWAIWFSDNNVEVALQSSTPTPYVTASSTPNLNATTSPLATATPLVSKTPTPSDQADQGQGGTGPAPDRVPVFVTMNSVNASGEYGVSAVIADDNDLAVVSFNLQGFPVGVYQNAYIVKGTCDGLGEIMFSLIPLINGSSISALDVDFLDVAQSQNRLAIVVYGPQDQSQIQYACGQLR